MKRDIKFLGLLLLTLVLIAASTPCFAMMDIAHVSRARAKELGMVLRVKAAGHATTVVLEFEIKGELKNFGRVDGECGSAGRHALRVQGCMILRKHALRCQSG